MALYSYKETMTFFRTGSHDPLRLVNTFRYHVISEPNLLWVSPSWHARGIAIFTKSRIAAGFFTCYL